jgi:hypothetical protein
LWTDFYKGVLEECIASAFDVDIDQVGVIDRGNKKTVFVTHSIKDENEVYERSQQVGTLLGLMVTKRNNFALGSSTIS